MENSIDDLLDLIHKWKSFRENDASGDAISFARWLLNREGAGQDAEKSVVENSKNVIRTYQSPDISNKALVGYLLGRMNMFVKNYAKEPFQKLGVASIEEFRLLALTQRLKNPNRSEISNEAMMEFSTVNDMLKRLEKRGLIAHEKDENDKRASRVSLTPKGKELLGKIFNALAGMQPKVTGDLSDEEQENLVSLLMRLNRFHTHYFETEFKKKK
ncbi:MarR family winged helix-turn-helix transcriptional regulator [Arachidicoccus soli]|uniref:MarR family transcriptional regulator n=1 Tax=Arachidicoccus soli TaxID=2341117 RepID=A0A386HRD2_9BACT|nr:MarR family transcriptional regulator [Arachidicoccus soli]AYD47834.1 MarR family transcriptional regulator [Arachidicoccus soli]